MSYNTKVYTEQGGAKFVVASGGSIDIQSGTFTVNGTQAAAIADITVTGTYATDDSAIETAVNSILTALRNAGIIASS